MKIILLIYYFFHLYYQCGATSIENHNFDDILCREIKTPAKIYLYKGSDQRELHNPSNLGINLDFPTYIYIHGWFHHTNDTGILNALYNKAPCNIIKVDYGQLAEQRYYCSPKTVRAVGLYVGNFIVKAYKAKQINVENIRFVGHSLGSHISGKAANVIYNKLNIKVARISALDPAGPLFALPLRLFPGDALQKDAAKFVDVLHTTILVGTIERMGTVDIYAKGVLGYVTQYPCLNDLSFSCNHAISKKYYEESISSCALRVQQINGPFSNIPYGYHMPENLEGIFTFTPNASPPYGKGDPNCRELS